MKLIAPDYYREFACIKGDCRHSCCVGWEIDIDRESLEYYRSIEGSFGNRLRGSIAFSEEGAYFRLGDGERCPFLNGDGLCDMILALGEDSLCQICADHPRFRNFYSDREEIGLGLCCEAAGRLVLGNPETVQLVALKDDGSEDSCLEDELHLLELRDRMISIAQDRRFPTKIRLAMLLEDVDIPLPEPDPVHWKEFLLTLERLDDSWAERLETLTLSGKPRREGMEIPLEQLLVYLIYRHLNDDDGDISGRIAYCALIWRLLAQMLGEGDLETLVELSRLYSSEIEYSDENMAAIIAELRRLHPEI